MNPYIQKLRSKILIVKWYILAPKRFIQDRFDKRWMPSFKIDISELFKKISLEKDVYFIQIGANDGITNDKIREYIEKYNWKGILVEPVPYVFSRLKKNYDNKPSLIFENSAISDKPGQMIFYSLKQYDRDGKSVFDDFKEYKIDQLGSFDKKTILKHSYMHSDFENLIEEIKVNCLTVDGLIRKYRVGRIDVLLIDTEGYDHKIISSIDFENVRPTVIIFEHQHLSKNEYREVVNVLKRYYQLSVDGWDTVGYLRSIH